MDIKVAWGWKEVIGVIALGLFFVLFVAGSQIIADRACQATCGSQLAQLQADNAQLHAIADMREQLFQQDERKLEAVRWCVTSSPTPIECVRWSLEETR